ALDSFGWTPTGHAERFKYLVASGKKTDFETVQRDWFEIKGEMPEAKGYLERFAQFALRKEGFNSATYRWIRWTMVEISFKDRAQDELDAHNFMFLLSASGIAGWKIWLALGLLTTLFVLKRIYGKRISRAFHGFLARRSNGFLKAWGVRGLTKLAVKLSEGHKFTDEIVKTLGHAIAASSQKAYPAILGNMRKAGATERFIARAFLSALTTASVNTVRSNIAASGIAQDIVDILIRRIGVEKEDVEILAFSARALGRLGDLRAVDPLIGLFNNIKPLGDLTTDEEKKWAADKKRAEEKRLAKENKKLTADEKRQIDEEADKRFEAKRNRLYARMAVYRAAAVEAIGNIIGARDLEDNTERLCAERAEKAIILQLESPDESLKRAIIKTLGQIGAKKRLEPITAQKLTGQLADGNPEVYKLAEKALVASGEAVIEPVKNVLNSAAEGVQARAGAAYVLGEMGAADERKASDFISCLTDALEAQTEDTVFGRALVQAISKVGKYTAHILLTFLQVDSEYVRCGVIQILGNVASSPDWTPDGEIIPGLIDILFDPGTTDTVRKETITSLAKIGKHAVSELISALDSEDAYVRAVAAEALGDPHNKDAIVPLGEKLKDAEVSVRKAAAIALGQIYDVQAVPFLKEALRDPEADVRTATIRTLVQIGSYRHEANQNMRAQMITDLIDIVAVDESQTVHPEIMVALVQLGATEHQLFTASQTGLQNENFAVRELAITDLRGLPREFPDLRGNVVLALLDSLADDVLSVFQAASMSLSILTADKEEIASGCVAAVASQKKSGNMHVRLAALELLNGLNVKNEGVERGLRECLSDDEISVRIAARKIIAGFDYSFVDEIEVVVEGAVKNLEHEDHDVRINAVMNVLQGSYQYELWSYAVDAAVEMAGKIGADTDVNAKRTEEIKRDIVKRLNEVAEQFHTEHENRSDYLWLINRGVAALGGQGTQQMEAVTETEEREDIKRRVMDLVDQADDLGTPILDVMTLTWLRDLYENNTFTDDENRRGCIVIITNHVPEFGTKLDFEQQKRVIIAAHDYSKGIIPDAEEADTSAGVTPPDGPRAPPTGVGVPGGPAGPEVLGGPEAPAAEAPENTIEINYDALDKLVAGHVKAFGDTEKSLYLEPQTSRAFPNEKSKITPPKGAKWTRVFLGALLIVVSIAMHARYGSMVGMGVYLGIGILGAAMIAKAFLGRYLQDSSAAPDRAKEQDRTVEEMQETLEGINASMARASYFETIGGDSSLLCGLSSTMEEVYFTDWSHERLAQLRDIMLVQTKTVSDNLNQLDVDLADEEADEIKEILTGAVNNEFKTYKRALRLTAESIAGYIQQQLPELQELERKFNADQTYNNREELEKKRDEIRRAIREMSAARGIPKFDKEQEGQFTAAVGSLKAYKDLGEMIKKFKDLKIERSDSAELQAWLQA
ncbi:MAG: HEAT repeat domain-containing protein, partial [Candidatus Omnitrophota bacterium]